jgi:hypothetical protein
MSNNKQQTAVEWLISQLHKTRDWQRVINEANESSSSVRDIIEQAKEMEWDQINDAYLQGFEDNDCNTIEDTFNLYYYNETYGGNK